MLRGVNFPKSNTNCEVISRQNVINWINTTLKFQCRRIEDLASGNYIEYNILLLMIIGAAYCLLMDILFPGKIVIMI